MKWVITKRIMAMVTAITTIFTMGFTTDFMSIEAMAAEPEVEEIITDIGSLNDTVAVQYLDFGASEGDIVFPDSLQVTVEKKIETIIEETEPEAIPEEAVEVAPVSETNNIEEAPAAVDSVPEEAQPEIAEEPAVEVPATEEVAEPEAIPEETAEEVTEPEAITEEVVEEAPAAEEPAEEAIPEAPVEAVPEAPAEEPAEEGTPVASIINVIFPAMTVYAAEAEEETEEQAAPAAGVFAQVSNITSEIIEVPETEIPAPVEEAVEETTPVEVPEAVAVPEATPANTAETISVTEQVTLTGIKWKIKADESSSAQFDSSLENAKYVYVPVIPEKYNVTATLPTITVIVGAKLEYEFYQSVEVDGVIITVKADEGVFPQNAVLSARSATVEEENVFEEAVEELEGEVPVVSSYVFDINILDENGNEIQPDNSKGQVYVSFATPEIGNEDLQVEVYHIPDSENGATEAEKLEVDVNGIVAEAETDSFSIYGVNITATTNVMENDEYPYMKDQNSSSVTLSMKIQSGQTASYQWVKSTDKTNWTSISGATTQDYVISGSNLVNGTWYACVVNGNDSKAVQLVQRGGDGRTWTGTKSQFSWYVTNGAMAYSINVSNQMFDITGKYVKNNTTYMLQTVYGSNGWQMVTKNNTSGPEAVYFRFTTADDYAVLIDADLPAGATGFSFGCDTMLGNSTTSNSYSDRAALEAMLTGSNLKHVAMIGAASSETAAGTDPAFVIKPITTTGLKFWLGNYSSRQHFAYNIRSSSDGNYTVETVNGTANVVTKVNDVDSGMTMSWYGVPDGGVVQLQFSVGDVEHTGAVGGNVDYSNEVITGLEINTNYTITVTEEGVAHTYPITSSGTGTIPLINTTVPYNFIGKSVTITKDNSTDSPSTIEIAGRPAAQEVDNGGTQDGGDATRPVDVGSAVVSTTANSIIINVGDLTGQEYRLCDENGTEISGQGWITPTNGTYTFTPLEANTTYKIKARVKATDNAPASEASTGVNVTTKGSVVVQEPEIVDLRLMYDGQPHTFGITSTTEGATITYSVDPETPYGPTVPSFTNAGTYTVYYKAEKEGCTTTYGSFEVRVDKTSVARDLSRIGTIQLSADGCIDDVVSLGDFLLPGDTVFLNEERNLGEYSYYAFNDEFLQYVDNYSLTDNSQHANLRYSISRNPAGTTGELYIVIDNPNYVSEAITIPFVTTKRLDINIPSEDIPSTIISSGGPQSLPIGVGPNEDVIVEYSTDGVHFGPEVPTFEELGPHKVFYKVTKPNSNFTPIVGDYDVIIYPEPVVEQPSIWFDGGTHSFPATIEEEGYTISYKLSEDGEYIEGAPEFSEVGDHVVYYKIEKEGFPPAYGSYVVTIHAPRREEERKNYPPLKETVEEETTTTTDTTTEAEDTNTKGKNKKKIEPIVEEEEIDKGLILDRGNIWKDMPEGTKLTLLEKLGEKGGEIIFASDVLVGVLPDFMLDTEGAEGEDGETDEENQDKLPVGADKPIALVMGDGAVIVSVETPDGTVTATGLADAKAVAKSLLTEEQYEKIALGSILEIKVEATPLTDSDIPEADRKVIEEGLAASAEEIPDITMANFIDLSMYMRIDDGEWSQITETDDIEIIVEIPKEYRGLSDTYYIMRCHNGVYTVLEDLDDDPDTVTISTGQFSTYALMYVEPQAAVATEGLDNVVDSADGSGGFAAGYVAWFFILLIAAIVIFFLASRRKKNE